MPRHARILLPGTPLHIIQRGHYQQPCFHTVADRFVYLDLMREHAAAHAIAIHAYVLMTNHVHLLLSFGRPDEVIDFMRLLGQQYSQYLNRRIGRSGTLWDGRYKSSPVRSEPYFLICHRYIELNPVRAGMVRRPVMYPWSSYRGNAGLVPNRLVTPHELYLRLGANRACRATYYRELCKQAVTQAQLRVIRNAANGNYPIGGTPGRRGPRPGSAAGKAGT